MKAAAFITRSVSKIMWKVWYNRKLLQKKKKRRNIQAHTYSSIFLFHIYSLLSQSTRETIFFFISSVITWAKKKKNQQRILSVNHKMECRYLNVRKTILYMVNYLIHNILFSYVVVYFLPHLYCRVKRCVNGFIHGF